MPFKNSELFFSLISIFAVLNVSSVLIKSISHSHTPGSRQESPTEAVERLGPSQSGMEMMGQHHPHVMQPPNPVANKPPTEDFQNQEPQNMGGMEQQTGMESLQFDYAGNQIQVDSSDATVGLFDYTSQQQV